MSFIGESKLGLRTKRALAVAFVALSMTVSGCGTLQNLYAVIKDAFTAKMPVVEFGDLHVLTDTGANLNTALELEIVLVQDEDVLKKASELTAAKWFELREDIRKTYPGGFESFHWELVPGQDLRLSSEQFKDKRAFAVLVYANYLTPGEHRARIDRYRNGAIIRLLAKGFTVTSRGDTAQTR